MTWMMRQTAPFADDTKLGGVGETSDECAACQRDSDSLQKWVNRILIKFKKRKCQVLHLGRKSEVPEDGLKHYVWAPFFFSWGPSSRNVLLPALVSCSTWSTSSVKAGAVCTTGDLFLFTCLWQWVLGHGRALQLLTLRRSSCRLFCLKYCR